MWMEDPLRGEKDLALILYESESVGEPCGADQKTHPISESCFLAVLVEKLRRSKIEITIHV